MRIIPDKSWIDIPRHHRFRDTRYKEGCEAFMRYAEMNLRNLRSGAMYCPCCRCRNLKLLNRNDIRIHLMKSGFDEKYKYWNWHGEGITEDEDPNVRVGMSGGQRIDDTETMLNNTFPRPTEYDVEDNVEDDIRDKSKDDIEVEAEEVGDVKAASVYISQEEEQTEPDPHMLSAKENITFTQNLVGHNRRGRYHLHGVGASPGISVRSSTASSTPSISMRAAPRSFQVMPFVARISAYMIDKIDPELHIQVTNEMTRVALTANSMDDLMGYVIQYLGGAIPYSVYGGIIRIISSIGDNFGARQSSAQSGNIRGSSTRSRNQDRDTADDDNR